MIKPDQTISALILLSVFSLSGCTRSEPAKPNFLLILTDDLSFNALGYNNPLVKTPNIDKLAKQGIIFNRTYISTPVCAASRASLLTGLYPQTNGTVALNTQAFREIIVKEKRYKTLPQFLKQLGYSCYFSGKSHLGDPIDYGFSYGSETPDFDDQQAFLDVDKFIEMPEFAQKPFLLWFAVRQPHVPLKPEQTWLNLYADVQFPTAHNFLENPPEESFYNQGLPGENFYRDSDYTDNYKNLPSGPPRTIEVINDFTKAYYATVSHLDSQIGELIDKLESKNLMKNTVLIFLSDNGYFLGNHGLGNKLTMHEESVHVPMFVCWDKLGKVNVHSDALISSVDILPTILSLAGGEMPDYLQGSSFENLFSDPSSTHNTFVISESVGVGGVTGTGHRMATDGTWKYMLSDTGEEALFNLREDPYELENLFNAIGFADEIGNLKSSLEKWQKITGDKKSIPGQTKVN